MLSFRLLPVALSPFLCHLSVSWLLCSFALLIILSLCYSARSLSLSLSHAACGPGLGRVGAVDCAGVHAVSRGGGVGDGLAVSGAWGDTAVLAYPSYQHHRLTPSAVGDWVMA